MLEGIDEYLRKARSVTCYDIANRFNVRMSVARKILRDKENEGVVVPYVKESGFVVYTTPGELKKREVGAPVMLADALEEVASSVPDSSVITDEMDVALAAAATPGAVKPSKLARKRREAGEKKERRDKRPEVIVEPLVESEETEPESEPAPPKKEEKAAKKPVKKPTTKAEPKPKKAEKKPAKKAEPKPKKDEKKPAKKDEPRPKKAESKPKKDEKKADAKPKTAEKTKVTKPELTDVDGVGPKTAEALRDGGFKTVAALSKADVKKLSEKVAGVAETTAASYIEHAKKLMAEYEKGKK